MHKLKSFVNLIIMHLIINIITEVKGYKSYKGYKVISIFPENDEDFQKIRTIIENPDLDVWRSTKVIGMATDVMVAPSLQEEFIDTLNRNELIHEITLDDIQSLIDEERVQQKQERIKTRYRSKYSYQKFFKNSEIIDYLNYLKTEYPNLVRIIKYGKSYEGRDLNMVHISSDFGNSKRRAILIDGGIHPREWISTAQVLYIIHQLVELHSMNKALIKKVDWYLIPTLNPDGYEYTFTEDRMWRKSRSIVAENCTGVDLNRNFDYMWKKALINGKICHDAFPGNNSFSEPETTALAKFSESIKNQLKLYLSFHAYGELILYPWAYTIDALPKNYKKLVKIGEKLERVMGYYYGAGRPGDLIYKSFGTSMDWFKGRLDVDLVFTIELSPNSAETLKTGMLLPEHQIRQVVINAFRGVRYLGHYVSNSASVKNVNIFLELFLVVVVTKLTRSIY